MLETSNKTFNDFYLSQEMLKALRAVSYEQPTPVQEASIPLILAGIDIIVQAQTGSGKTAAFAVPTIEMLEPHPGRVDVLVLAPTRELAKQVCDEFSRLGRYKDLTATAIYGGSSYEKQYEALEHAQIVCATPGRLLDLLHRKKLDLSHLRILCLDEADEMLSMGFRDDIEAIIAFCPEERQSLLFSATINEGIKSLAGHILFYPEYLTMSSDSVATLDVTHYYYNVRGVGRPRDVIKVLEYEEPESALIFANTKDDTFMLTTFLKRHGYRAEVLNGDLPQAEREKTLAAMRAGKIDYIVATDVAARGIDISDLSHVINYTLPDSAEVYIHRTGRTGRAGKKGTAISLIAPTEVATFFQVKKLYEVKLEQRQLPSTHEIVVAKQGRALNKLGPKLQALDHLRYGGKLGMAEQLLAASADGAKEIDKVRLVARLLALADNVLLGREPLREETVGLTNGKAAAAAEAQAEAVEVAPEPQAEVEVEVAPTEVAPEEAIEEAVKAVEVEPETGGRRAARAARAVKVDGEVPVPVTAATRTSEEPRVEEAAADEPKRPKRVRSRRRRPSLNGGDEAPVAQPAAPAQASPEITATAPEADEEEPALEPMRKMYINMGRDRFDDPNEVVDMVCYMAGVDPEDVGDVTLENSFSYVYVRRDYFDDILCAIHQQEWNGATITAEPARK